MEHPSSTKRGLVQDLPHMAGGFLRRRSTNSETAAVSSEWAVPCQAALSSPFAGAATVSRRPLPDPRVRVDHESCPRSLVRLRPGGVAEWLESRTPKSRNGLP